MEGKSGSPDPTSKTDIARKSIVFHHGEKYTNISRSYEKVGDAGCFTLERDFA